MNALPHRQNETVFEAQVESIATGGAGVARLDGRAVFIPKTAPGDTIRFRIVKDKGKYLLGELLRIIQTGPARTPPPCAHWSDCGGCALQHIETPAQMEAKKRIFLDTLTRIGKIELGVPVQTITLPENANRYRMRARFQIRGSGIGFFAPGTRRLSGIEDCLLVEPSIANALHQIRHLLQAEPKTRKVEAVEMTSLGSEDEASVGLYLHPVGHRDHKTGKSIARRSTHGKNSPGKPFSAGHSRWTRTRRAPHVAGAISTRYGASGFALIRIARILHSAQPGAQPDSREERESKNQG